MVSVDTCDLSYPTGPHRYGIFFCHGISMNNLRLWGESKLFARYLRPQVIWALQARPGLFATNPSLALSVLVPSAPDNSPTYMSHIPS